MGMGYADMSPGEFVKAMEDAANATGRKFVRLAGVSERDYYKWKRDQAAPGFERIMGMLDAAGVPLPAPNGDARVRERESAALRVLRAEVEEVAGIAAGNAAALARLSEVVMAMEVQVAEIREALRPPTAGGSTQRSAR